VYTDGWFPEADVKEEHFAMVTTVHIWLLFFKTEVILFPLLPTRTLFGFLFDRENSLKN
jgi:hypothetical protein